MRRVRDGVTAVLFFLAFGGEFWRSLPAGPVTRAVVETTTAVCPMLMVGREQGITVAGGAHALDVAVLRRTLDAALGGNRCHTARRSA